jgi:hypothetical protein
MLDHIQILIAQDHVRPPGLCNVYTTILINACMCESSFSLAFLSIAFRTNVDFGQRDWKLLVNVCVIGPFFSRLNGFTHGCFRPDWIFVNNIF